MSYQELGRGRQALGSVSVLFFLNKQGSDRSPCFLLIIEIGHLSGLLLNVAFACRQQSEPVANSA